MADRTGITVAATGSTYFEHPLSVHRDDGFLKLVELLRGADATYANLECTIQDGEDWPAFGGGMGWAGSYMGAPPSMVDELKYLGVQAVFAANNHAGDFGEGGILTTIKYLKRGGMPYAGIGASLTEATQPCYVETRHGRVAMISAADWGPRGTLELPFPWPAGYLPSDELPPYKSRPGVNLLRYEAVVHVDQEAFDQLRRISGQLDWEKGKATRRTGGGRTDTLLGTTLLGYEVDTDTEFFFMGRKFVRDTEFRISTFPFQEDLDRICKYVREARRQADVVIVAITEQAHGSGVLDYVRTFAYGTIDAGADIVINTGGTHNGVEIHKGKAIIYGMPGLHLQNDQMTHQPSSYMRRMGLSPDSTATDLLVSREENRARGKQAGGQPHESSPDKFVLVAVFTEQADLKELQLHPFEDSPSRGARERKGIPRLPETGSEVARRILHQVVERSRPFGTAVEIRDGVGVVQIK